MIGLGVMINMLGGNEDTANAVIACVGKKISNAVVDDDKLRLRFDDGGSISFWDSGQSCCEHRYMRCDDDLSKFAGAEFLGAEIVRADSADSDWGCHEIEFLNINTSLGVFQVANHNEHNGYYGGLSIIARCSYKVGK